MCVYSRVKVPRTHQSTMGGGGSKPEPAVKGDGVTTVDNSFSVVNIHVTTVVYMSIVVVLVIAIIALVYIYVKRGGLYFCLPPAQPVQQQLPIYHPPRPAARRHSLSNVKPASVVELVRMEDGSEAVMRTYTVGEERPRPSHSASLSTLLHPMKGMGES